MGVGTVKDELVDALSHDGGPDVDAGGDLFAESLAVLLSLSVGHLLCQVGDVLHLFGVVGCYWLSTDQGEQREAGHGHQGHSDEQESELGH